MDEIELKQLIAEEASESSVLFTPALKLPQVNNILVYANQGQGLQVTSGVGRGTTFTFQVPVKTTTQRDRADARSKFNRQTNFMNRDFEEQEYSSFGQDFTPATPSSNRQAKVGEEISSYSTFEQHF